MRNIVFISVLLLLTLNVVAQDVENPEEATSRSIEIGQQVSVSPGDTLEFGSRDQNKLTIEFIRDRSGRDFHEMGVMPGIGPGTLSENPLRIIFPNGRDYGGLIDTSFESGNFDVDVESHSVENQSAKIKIVPRYSDSSNFNCENYDLNENQYAFCSNTDEDAERGAQQQIDLGHRTEVINFVRNSKVTGERYAKTGVNHLFVNPDSGRTLQFWQQDENTYKGAGIEIIEWRGLSEEHSGNNMEAIVEVDPVSEPDASLSFGKSNYETREEIDLNFEAFEPGRYELRVSGAGKDTTKSYDRSISEDNLKFEASEEGEIQANLVAPGRWWNPLDSDRTVAEASTEVQRPFSEVNHEFGEKFSIGEGQSTQIEGRNFYLSTLVGSSENGYPSILWRSSEDSNSNSPLVHLRRINSMKVQYGDGFNAYGVVCSINPDTDSAEILIKEERFNPWEACDRHPSELRQDNNYDMRDYNLGEKVTLRPGEGLEFGESRVYLEEIDMRGEYLNAAGHSEWVSRSFGYWSPPPEGSFTENVFYEGEISTATCKANMEEIEIVMERSSETSSDSPDNWCESENTDNNEESTDQSFDCEEYNTGSNEFKFCNPGTKNIEIGDQSYEAEFWFVNKESGAAPTAEIDFKDSSTFIQLRPRGSTQVNDDAPAKNGYNLYLKEYSGADSQSPEDDSIVIEYNKDPEEGVSVTYVMEFDISMIDEDGRIEMANGFNTVDSDDEVVSRSGVLEVGETYSAKFIQDGETLYTKEVEAPSPSELEYNEDVNQPILEIEFDPENDVVDEEQGESQESGFEIITESPFKVDESIQVQASANQKIADAGYYLAAEGPRNYESEFNGQGATFEFTPERPGEYNIVMRPSEGLLSSIISSLTGSETIQSQTIIVESDRPVWRDYCSEKDYSSEASGLVRCVQSEIVPAYFEDSVGENPRIADSLCQDIIGLRYSEESYRCE